MSSTTLPALTTESGLSRYLQEIQRFPLLEPDEEYMLAKRYVEDDDKEAAHKLVTSHLRLVAKIAMSFRGYGLPLVELISEGNIGLMQAVKRFDPEKGFRLSTYAMWWIRASIQEYVLRSWSLVKMGTTAAQKKLFFNLRKLRHRIEAVQEGDLTPDQVNQIAGELNVSKQDVVDMDRRMHGNDYSLNTRLNSEADEEWGDFLTSEEPSHEVQYGEQEELDHKRTLMGQAMSKLNERERNIIQARRLSEEPQTLEELSQHYNISRERVRQIEARAIEKLQQSVQSEG